MLLLDWKPAWADLRVTVRGTAEIDARVQVVGDALVIDGLLRDEAGVAISGGNIRAFIEGAGNDIDGMNRGIRPCDESIKVPANFQARSDGTGRFCIRTQNAMTAGRVALDFPATSMFDTAHVSLPFDITKHPLAIDFDSRGGEVSLDGDFFLVEVFVGREEGGLVVASAGHVIALTNEEGKLLGSAVSDNSGRARFNLPAHELGPPGAGFLKARFPGDARTLPSEAKLGIVRTARVILRAEGPDSEVRTQDGFTVLASVEFESALEGASSKSGPRGTIEVFSAGVPVGAAPVENGRAHVELTLDRPRGEVELVLRYLPTHPWFVCHEDAVVRVHARGAGPLRTLALVALCAAVVAAVVWSRRRVAASSAQDVPEAAAAVRAPTPHVEVIRRGRSDTPVWTGEVIDAHEGTPIAGASVVITRGTFTALERLGATVTDAGGMFELALNDFLPSDELAVEGPLHSKLAQRVPTPGELRVALVLRKRHILTRFVEWARERGLVPAGGVRAPEVTPGEVRDRAAGFATAQWAAELERAAFGPDVVDASLEEKLEELRAQAFPPDPARPQAAASGDPRYSGPPKGRIEHGGPPLDSVDKPDRSEAEGETNLDAASRDDGRDDFRDE